MNQLFDKEFMKENMMGPNAVMLLEELAKDITLKPGMRVLDLGCGKGLTSMWLANQFDIQIFALDLWISATENYQRFLDKGLDDRIIPIHADALQMPFAEDYFDAVISVDSYQYYGTEELYMDNHLAPLVKKAGIIAIVVPGVKRELQEPIPQEMALSWTKEDISTFHSCEWWKTLLRKSSKTDMVSIKEMQCFDESWNDWLECDNEYAVSDRPAMNAGAGKYMNFISMICKRK